MQSSPGTCRHNFVIDDDEPIYDRLGEKGSVVKMPRSATRRHDSMNFRCVKGKNQATRESAINLADDLISATTTPSQWSIWCLRLTSSPRYSSTTSRQEATPGSTPRSAEWVQDGGREKTSH